MHVATLALLMVIRTYDVFGVLSRDLDVAKWTAANILQRAGIATLWIDCPGGSPSPLSARTCADVLQADEVMVRILKAPARKREGAGSEALGDAYIDTAAGRGSLATLYADRIAAMASASGFDSGTLLGRVMAHEIGHLLLGTAAHQREGIMRAQWSAPLLQRPFRREWEFTPSDVKSLARNLELRIRNSEFVIRNSEATSRLLSP